jgi:hypothetical protein
MDILLLLLITPLAYGLPGYLLLETIGLHDLHRGTRLALSVVASLVIVPFYFVAVSNFIPFTPNLWTALPLIAVLGASALWRRKVGGSALAIHSRVSEPAGRREAWLGWIWVLGFSLLINLPRLDFFVGGSAAAWASSGDEYWHLCELVSVAGSGLPPRHYFFPDVSLVYYYWSWIYPAILSNLQPQWFAPARTLALHSFVQTAAFIGLAWLILRWNIRDRWARAFGLWGITIAGGFDFFASLTLTKFEDWQLRVPWLASTNQVSSFPNIYIWVPQHVAGAMAFLLGIALWRNARAPGWVRGVMLGVLMAFCLGTSAFVFLSAALASAVWFLLYRHLWRSRGFLLSMACALPAFLLGAWYSLQLSIGRTDALLWNVFRVPVLEGLLQTNSVLIARIDQALTIVGFPVVTFWVMLVEMGLPFLLYLLWCVFYGYGAKNRWHRFLAIFPPAFILLTYVMTDSDPGRNFITRGMIPVEVAILLGGAEALALWRAQPHTRAQRIAVGYGMAACMIVQMVTPFADIRDRAMQSLGTALDARIPMEVAGITVADAVDPFPAKSAYQVWINNNTPMDALVVEYGPLEDTTIFRLLQRMRYLVPATADQLGHIQTDLDLLSLYSYAEFRARLGDSTPIEAVSLSPYIGSHHPPVYFVVRDSNQMALGALVYSDYFVRIYRSGPIPNQ